MRLSLVTVVSGLSTCFLAVTARVPPLQRHTIAPSDGPILEKRVEIIPTRPIDPVHPIEEIGPGVGPPGSPSSAHSQNSGNSILSTASWRFRQYQPEEGMNQVLMPEEYIARGKAVLESNRAAANANPRVDTVYDHWSVRYERTFDEIVGVGGGGAIPSEDIGASGGDDIRGLLGSIGMNADIEWSSVSFASRAFHGRAADKTEFAASMYIDKENGAVMVTSIIKDADIDPAPGPDGNVPARLYSSELIAQGLVDVAGSLKDLKHIIQFPISNQGTRLTIKDAFVAKGYTSEHYQSGGKGEFYPEDTEFAGLLGNAWSGIAGTVNGRPAALLTADHAASSEGLQIVKIHAWYEVPNGGEAFSALDLEMGHPQ